MGWVFSRDDNDGEQVDLRPHLTTWLAIVDEALVIQTTAPQDDASILGIVYVERWGVKLQAAGHELKIMPGQPQQDASIDPPIEEYTLQPQTERRIEIIFLRNQDQIFSPTASGRLTLTWNPPQVQVNSSVNAEGEIADSEDVEIPDDAAIVEAETEDEEDLDRSPKPDMATEMALMHKRQPGRSTPLPSAVSRTEIIQETPTVNRINVVAGMPSREPSRGESDAVENTPVPGEEAATANGETFSTAPVKMLDSEVEAGDDDDDDDDDEPPVSRSARHPKVKIPTKAVKRASPDADEESITPSASVNKRRKLEDEAEEVEEKEGDTIVVRSPVRSHVRKSAVKKKRAPDGQEATPIKSQRSSQRSAAEEYDGPKPRVAFSNSGIPLKGDAIKFLKRQGGTTVDSIKDDCNVLCVKDGTLVKTMKLLQSIALGIPIVTDKWLLDSAKATHFLPLKDYIPHVPAQEKEWNFSISNIWSTPQNTLFTGYTINFTPALKAIYKDFKEMEQVCKAVGARRVVSKKAGGKDVDGEDTIILAAEEDDKDAATLIEGGHTCFTKDFLTNSILRGAIDLGSDEFKVVLKASQPKKKGRNRKS